MKDRPAGSVPPLPKYFRIAAEIIEQIKSGNLDPGMQVPSENEIIKRYSVSNTTARKALNEIESAGWAVRIKGKGTFVRRNDVVRSATKILSFTRNMLEAGYTPSSRVLFRGILPDGYSARINGRRYTMKGPVYKIHRLRFADETPMLLEVRYISAAFCPGIDEKKLEGSLYDIYRQDYGLELTEIEQMLSTVIMDAGTLEFFNLTEPAPALLLEGVTFAGKELPLEMERSIYRGDKYRFAVRASGSGT
jgi:GntR family transcriptional regulator